MEPDQEPLSKAPRRHIYMFKMYICSRAKASSGREFLGRFNESLSDRPYSRRFSETLSPDLDAFIWAIVLFILNQALILPPSRQVSRPCSCCARSPR